MKTLPFRPSRNPSLWEIQKRREVTMETEKRQKFLEGRKGIGSSDVPQILGWSQWGGPADVYDSITSVTRRRRQAVICGGTWQCPGTGSGPAMVF